MHLAQQRRKARKHIQGVSYLLDVITNIRRINKVYLHGHKGPRAALRARRQAEFGRTVAK
jgi:hypothetical protein